MRVLFALLLAGCVPSQAHLDAENKSAASDADAKAAAAGTPFTPASTSVPLTRAGITMEGLIAGELVVRTDTGELAFAGGACLERAKCGDGCAVSATYHYVHARDGHVVIVRDRPIAIAVATRDDPSCPAGCGGGTPPPPPLVPVQAITVQGLGITDPAQLEVRDNRYEVKYIARRCTNTTPVP